MKASLTSFGAPANFRSGYYQFRLSATYLWTDVPEEYTLDIGTVARYCASHASLKRSHTVLMDRIMREYPLAVRWTVEGVEVTP